MEVLIGRYKDAFIAEVGQPHAENGLPVPWFAKNVWDKVQWAAYIGDCCGKNALAFGINIEFLPTWRKIRPRLSLTRLQNCLEALQQDEWHWQGRPGYVCRNPEIFPLYVHQPVRNIELAVWFDDLDDILAGRKAWRNGRPMRPQLQIMRRIGDNTLSQGQNEIRRNIRHAMSDMQPLMDMLCNRR